MKFAIIQENSGGEICREEVELATNGAEDDMDFADRVDDAITEVLEGWIFAVGDTIRIVEVQS